MNIKITIDGPTNSGKSTIAQAISKLLNAHGIKTEVHDDEMSEKSLTILYNQSPATLMRLSDKDLNVEIVMRQTVRF